MENELLREIQRSNKEWRELMMTEIGAIRKDIGTLTENTNRNTQMLSRNSKIWKLIWGGVPVVSMLVLSIMQYLNTKS